VAQIPRENERRALMIMKMLVLALYCRRLFNLFVFLNLFQQSRIGVLLIDICWHMVLMLGIGRQKIHVNCVHFYFIGTVGSFVKVLLQPFGNTWVSR
jgi:hypothetical protein